MNYIIGNWKSNKTLDEGLAWLDNFASITNSLNSDEVVLCPPFIHLPAFYKKIQDLKRAIILGAQDISPFENGAYTGEVSAPMLASFIKYVIIGHSERRNYFKEEDNLLYEKVKIAKKYNIEPIYCVQSDRTFIPDEVTIVAYEPVQAIGTGNPADPEAANQTLKLIRENHPQLKAGIYGGSVKADNVARFMAQPFIDGVLPGGASLDVGEFTQIIQNISQI